MSLVWSIVDGVNVPDVEMAEWLDGISAAAAVVRVKLHMFSQRNAADAGLVGEWVSQVTEAKGCSFSVPFE